MAPVLVAVRIDQCLFQKNPSKTVMQNLVTWTAEGIHKVAVGGRQKKSFEQLIFQSISEERPDLLRESILKCGITVTNNDLLL